MKEKKLPTCAFYFPGLDHHALGHVDVLLEEPAPGGHVDVHLVRSRHFALLSEYLPLAAQLWFPGYQGVQELDLNKLVVSQYFNNNFVYLFKSICMYC